MVKFQWYGRRTSAAQRRLHAHRIGRGRGAGAMLWLQVRIDAAIAIGRRWGSKSSPVMHLLQSGFSGGEMVIDLVFFQVTIHPHHLGLQLSMVHLRHSEDSWFCWSCVSQSTDDTLQQQPQPPSCAPKRLSQEGVSGFDERRGRWVLFGVSVRGSFLQSCTV